MELGREVGGGRGSLPDEKVQAPQISPPHAKVFGQRTGTVVIGAASPSARSQSSRPGVGGNLGEGLFNVAWLVGARPAGPGNRPLLDDLSDLGTLRPIPGSTCCPSSSQV